MMRAVVVAVTALAVAAGMTACGDGSSSSSSTSLAPSAAATSTATPSRARPRHPEAKRARRRADGPGVLAASTADAFTVQPQAAAGSCGMRGSGLIVLPDGACTPGAIDPAVTQANIQSTICRAGYTRTVRPPESVTEPEKVASIAAYGDTGPTSAYEYDHLVPLELGGARNDSRNLWPEPGASPNPKDAVEGELRAAVCDGRLPLAVAQRAIARDWPHAGVAVPNASAESSSSPAASPAPAPAPAPAPSPSAEGPGSLSHADDVAFCTTHRCIANFPHGHGTVVRCADGEWSHSGGLNGVCYRHGGVG